MKMTPRIKSFIKDPKSFSCRKIANLCKEEELDHEFMFKYQIYLNWKILLVKYAHQFSFEELDLLLPIVRNRRLLWEFITTQTFSEEQLDRFIKDKIFSGYNIFRWHKVSEKFIEDHLEVCYWDTILEYQTLSEEFLRKHADDINKTSYHGSVCWSIVSQYQTLSDQFIRNFNRKLDWQKLSHYHLLSKSIMKEFADKIWWSEVPYNEMSEELIEEFEYRVDWKELSKRKKNLSYNFIDKWAHKLDWFNLCYFNKVNSSLLIKYVEKLNFNWDVLYEKQNLSEEFMREYRDKLDWDKILKNHTLSKDFIREMFDIIGDDIIWIIKVYNTSKENYEESFKKEMQTRYYKK